MQISKLEAGGIEEELIEPFAEVAKESGGGGRRIGRRRRRQSRRRRRGLVSWTFFLKKTKGLNNSLSVVCASTYETIYLRDALTWTRCQTTRAPPLSSRHAALTAPPPGCAISCTITVVAACLATDRNTLTALAVAISETLSAHGCHSRAVRYQSGAPLRAPAQASLSTCSRRDTSLLGGTAVVTLSRR